MRPPRIRSPLTAIRARCLGCSEDIPGVRECDRTGCELQPYRTGHRPRCRLEGLPSPVRAIRYEVSCLWLTRHGRAGLGPNQPDHRERKTTKKTRRRRELPHCAGLPDP